ncbi:hypothetical protein [Paraburkholderia xenovorans]|jgi:hypothetical protein|nr:hypothetical protein [Paraburkholderia xenovorans]NPT33009.1 hypothetical protein [Paraburkholderia xenovorans]
MKASSKAVDRTLNERQSNGRKALIAAFAEFFADSGGACAASTNTN